MFVREISVEEADAIYDVRESLEELVGVKLAGQVGKTEIKELHDLCWTTWTRPRAAKQAALPPAQSCISAIVWSSFTGNAKPIAIYRRLIKELHLFSIARPFRRRRIAGVNEEHRAIVAAIEKGNAERPASRSATMRAGAAFASTRRWARRSRETI